MKKLLCLLFVVSPLMSMEEIDLTDVSPSTALARRLDSHTSTEIVEHLTHVIINLGNQVGADEKQYHTLITQFFKKESAEIENSIMPHLKKRLRDSDDKLSEILEKDDREQLITLVNKLISESIEDAFKEKEDTYQEFKVLSDERLKKTKYALATAIVSGIAGVLTVFFSVYFGKS